MPDQVENLDRNQLRQVLDQLDELESRLTRVEETIGEREVPRSSGVQELAADKKQPEAAPPRERAVESSLEFRIGHYWLAQLGTVVLLLGLAFLISYPFANIPAPITTLLGFLAVAAVFALSYFWQANYPYLSRILFGGGLFLLYFATLRLHFFSEAPILESKTLGLAAVTVVLVLILYFASRRGGELLTALMLFVSYATCLISDTNHFALVLMTLLAGVAVYLLVARDWKTVALVGLLTTYATHLLWLLNNPVMGNPLQAAAADHQSFLYLFVYGGLFSAANMVRSKSASMDFFKLSFTLLHALGFFVVGFFIAITFFKPQLGFLNFLLASFLLVSAGAYWTRHQSIFATAAFASIGYMVLSVAIFTQFQSPNLFVWLGWQSLLVISTAIWFRSRILIVVNSLIYLAIFCAYLGVAQSHDLVNLSYAIVALTSARVLNWRKERLQLKTDLLRNAYLASAFVIVLYGLYQAVPTNYVSVSWLGASVFYFGLSLLLKNIKYRWLAILTILALIIRVFLVDLGQLGAPFRILLFLVVGSALLVVSVLYSKHRERISQNQ